MSVCQSILRLSVARVLATVWTKCLSILQLGIDQSSLGMECLSILQLSVDRALVWTECLSIMQLGAD